MNIKSYSDEELRNWITLASTEFYELVFKDEWLSQVFAVVSKELITAQQIDFMVELLGGPKLYSGRNANVAHTHIFITEEMWQVRENLLSQAFSKVKFPEDLQHRWLKIDAAFKKSIVMKDPSECKKRFNTDELIIINSPYKRAA